MIQPTAVTRVFRCLLALAVVIGLAACGKPEFQQRDVENHTPAIQAKKFVAADGKALPMRSWVGQKKPKAIVVAIHGFNDYSKSFEGAGAYFKKHDIALFALDQRGFGAGDQRGVWAGQDNLTRDMKQLVAAIRKRYGKTPVYLLGESMGGAVAIEAVVQHPDMKVDGVILSAPAVWGGDTMNWFYRFTLWMMVHTIPSSEVTGHDLGIVATDNDAILRDMIHDPLIIKATRVDAIYGIVNLMDAAHEHAPHINAPTLVLYGAHDQVIPRQPVAQLASQIQAPLVAAYYPDGYHMLLRDLQADVVLKDIVSWIGNHRKPLPSGYDKDVLEIWKSWAE